MKKKNLLLAFTITMLALTAHRAEARVWRVNNLSNYDGILQYGENFGGAYLNPVFKQPEQAAISGDVLAGDTLHIEGSPVGYASFSLAKKLIIIGAGYFLNENPNTSANLLPSEIGYISFAVGSEGSQLIGMTVTSTVGIDINTNNITIRRCKISYSIGFTYSITDFVIDGNYFEGSSTRSAITVSSVNAVANVSVTNNIFQKTLLPVNINSIATFTVCNNNVFDCPLIANNPSLRFNAAVFQNNIIKTPGATVNINNNSNQNVSFNYSATIAGQFGTANNNVVVDMNTLFVVQTGATSDGKYKLKAGSLVGADNTERGAFGGAAVTNRYVLSGLAPIPVVYNISTSGVAGPAGLPVIIKARTIQ